MGTLGTADTAVWACEDQTGPPDFRGSPWLGMVLCQWCWLLWDDRLGGRWHSSERWQGNLVYAFLHTWLLLDESESAHVLAPREAAGIGAAWAKVAQTGLPCVALLCPQPRVPHLPHGLKSGHSA